MVAEPEQIYPIKPDSPLEFILASNFGRCRRVVAKSAGVGWDLMARTKKAEISSEKRRSAFPAFFFFLRLSARNRF